MIAYLCSSPLAQAVGGGTRLREATAADKSAFAKASDHALRTMADEARDKPALVCGFYLAGGGDFGCDHVQGKEIEARS
jgi:hypothetical protein